MPTSLTLLQNQSITLKMSRNQASVCVAQSGANANAGQVLVAEGTLNDVDWITPLAGVDPTSGTGALVLNLTGPGKSMVIQSAAWSQIRLRRTDAVGGASDASLDVREF